MEAPRAASPVRKLATRRPNFLFIGPDKSGSTWLYEALRRHRQVFLPPVKELFFFDQFYAKGWSWYGGYFQNAGEHHRVVAEICHDYLFSPLACERIARDLPDAKLMVCLREPSQRAYSAYLYMIKFGLLDCDFETALHVAGELVDHGRYARHLASYFDYFDRGRIHVALFDDLAASPQKFFDGVCDFLSIERLAIPGQLKEKVLPATRPRLRRVTKFARGVGWNIRRMGFPGIVGKVKESSLLRLALYGSNGANEAQAMSSGVRSYLREVFTPEVRQLDALLGTNLFARWGYSESK